MMMEPVIYGPTPSITIERLESPPPEKIFSIPKNWLFERNLLSARVSIPGIGIAASNRNRIREPRTKSTFFLKDESFQTNFILLQKFPIYFLLFTF
jgi:hypothetical protein